MVSSAIASCFGRSPVVDSALSHSAVARWQSFWWSVRAGRRQCTVLPFYREFSNSLRESGVSFSQQARAFDAVDATGYSLAEFAVKTLGPAIVSAVAALCGAWAKARNGRKVRIKIGDVEAEGRTVEEIEARLCKIEGPPKRRALLHSDGAGCFSRYRGNWMGAAPAASAGASSQLFERQRNAFSGPYALRSPPWGPALQHNPDRRRGFPRPTCLREKRRRRLARSLFRHPSALELVQCLPNRPRCACPRAGPSLACLNSHGSASPPEP